MSYERDNIRNMNGYGYGEQPDDPNVVKLNTNENPYPPSPAVKQALTAFNVDVLRRYPSPTAGPFRKLVAERHHISADQVMVTNGGDEALRLAITTFVDPGEVFGMTDPTYTLYEVLANIQDCKVNAIELLEDWTPPRNFAAQLNDAGTSLTCIVNPHSPSGHLMNVNELGRLAEELRGVLLIDEAYVDFVDPGQRHDSAKLVGAFDNVLILRSLSKGYSLAGLRFGYVMGANALIDPMINKARDSYNVNAIAQSLASAAYLDQDYAAQTWEKVRRSRRELREGLIGLGLTVPISQANFVLAHVPLESPLPALQIYQRLKDRNILVRHFAASGLDEQLRITVGTPAENAALLVALEELLR